MHSSGRNNKSLQYQIRKRWCTYKWPVNTYTYVCKKMSTCSHVDKKHVCWLSMTELAAKICIHTLAGIASCVLCKFYCLLVHEKQTEKYVCIDLNFPWVHLLPFNTSRNKPFPPFDDLQEKQAVSRGYSFSLAWPKLRTRRLQNLLRTPSFYYLRYIWMISYDISAVCVWLYITLASIVKPLLVFEFIFSIFPVILTMCVCASQ